MSTIFEELKALDNPFVEFELAFGKTTKQFAARRLSAAETDALEAFFSDEYARLVIEKTEPKDGKQSELDRVLITYKMRPRHELLDQILGTRFLELQQRAAEIAGVDIKEAQKHAATLESDAAREAYGKEIEEALNSGMEQARKEIGAEYDTKSDTELAEIMAQVNVNMKAMTEARLAQDQQRLFYMLFAADKTTRVFPTIQSVRELQADTIERFKKAIENAFILAVAQDLPFVLQGVQEQNGRPSSAKPSVQETTQSNHGGKRTKRRRRNSKPFTKP